MLSRDLVSGGLYSKVERASRSDEELFASNVPSRHRPLSQRFASRSYVNAEIGSGRRLAVLSRIYGQPGVALFAMSLLTVLSKSPALKFTKLESHLLYKSDRRHRPGAKSIRKERHASMGLQLPQPINSQVELQHFTSTGTCMAQNQRRDFIDSQRPARAQELQCISCEVPLPDN